MGSMTVEANAKRVVRSSSGALADERDDRVEAPEEGFDEGAHEEIDEAWRAELLRRVQQVRSGEVEPVSWESVREHGRAALARQRG
jgi:putative addiction module component (TIGR02574 family)